MFLSCTDFCLIIMGDDCSSSSMLGSRDSRFASGLLFNACMAEDSTTVCDTSEICLS